MLPTFTSRVSDRLCLPEGVDDGTFLLSHHAVVPVPRLWVDGLTHGPQNLQGVPLVSSQNHHRSPTPPSSSLSQLSSKHNYRDDLHHLHRHHEVRPDSNWTLVHSSEGGTTSSVLHSVLAQEVAPLLSPTTHFCTGSFPYFISILTAVGAV